jgi:hypothetical protein
MLDMSIFIEQRASSMKHVCWRFSEECEDKNFAGAVAIDRN